MLVSCYWGVQSHTISVFNNKFANFSSIAKTLVMESMECSVCESALFSMQHGSFELSHSQTRVLHNL